MGQPQPPKAASKAMQLSLPSTVGGGIVFPMPRSQTKTFHLSNLKHGRQALEHRCRERHVEASCGFEREVLFEAFRRKIQIFDYTSPEICSSKHQHASLRMCGIFPSSISSTWKNMTMSKPGRQLILIILVFGCSFSPDTSGSTAQTLAATRGGELGMREDDRSSFVRE